MTTLPIDQNIFTSDNYNEKIKYIVFYLRSVLFTNLREKGEYGFTKLSDKELLREFINVSNEEEIKSLIKLILLLINLLEDTEVNVIHKYETNKTIVNNNRVYTLCKYGVNPLYVYDGDGSLKRIELGSRCTNKIFLESLYSETLRGFIKGRDRKVLKK